MIKLEEATEKESRGLFLDFLGKRIYDEENKMPVNGDRILQGAIIRFAGGYIHGGNDPDGKPQPAIECRDSHTEWWEEGKLHREGEPAIISDFGDWEEYWVKGKLVSIFYIPPDESWGIP
jgi:hypothetical protein